jgi:hypothetical protein
MRTAQRVITAVAAVLVMFGLGTTTAHAGSAKALAASYTLKRVQQSTKYPVLWWDLCETAGQEVIFLETVSSNCGSGSSAGNVWSFSALTNSSGSHVVEVCQYHSATTSEVIDQADSSGNSTGILHTYSDSAGGGCKVARITYPVRKFRSNWGGESSYWALPY